MVKRTIIPTLLVCCCLAVAEFVFGASALAVSPIADTGSLIPSNIAIDQITGDIYVVTGTGLPGANVGISKVAGGGITPVYDDIGLQYTNGLAAGGGYLFWGNANSGPYTDSQIFRAPESGSGSITAIYTGSSVGQPIFDISDLAYQGGQLYSIDYAYGHVVRLDSDGSNIQGLIGWSPTGIYEKFESISLSDDKIFGGDNAGIYSAPIGGGGFTTLATGNFGDIAFLNGMVYAIGGDQRSIWQVPASGGPASLFVGGSPFGSLNSIAAYNGILYVTDTSLHTIWWVPGPGAISEPNDYLIPGKSYMCEGSLSGLREAYKTFDAGRKDPNCAECAANRELTFLHAVTRTAMLFIDNSDLTVDGNSFLERAEEFGVDVPGDSFEFPDIFGSLGINVPLTGGRYIMPSDAPDANKISDMIHNSIIPEINDIIADLNSISDSPRFQIFFEPNDTKLENPLEVDYGEVLILKGLLLAFKSQLEAKLAYDVFVDVNETLWDNFLHVDGIPVHRNDVNYLELLRLINIDVNDPDQLSINNHFLTPYPNLLKVLPTPNDSNNGTAILAKSKKDLIDALSNYFTAEGYIEKNSPTNALVYVDPNDKFVLNTFNQKLTTLQNSLKNDTPATYPLETTKTYNVYDSKSKLIGHTVLVYDLTGLEGDANSLTFTITGVPTPWEVDWFGILGGTDLHKNAEFEADLECHSSGHWWDGWLEGTYNNNGNITDVTFEYWGDCNTSCSGHCCSVCSYDSYCCDVGWDSICENEARYDMNCNCGDTLEKLSCQLISTKVTNISINFNPIFGSPKYPKPVSPRDLLPQFDANNQPLAGTFGDGLGDDATLGGILPGMTQQGWINLLRLSAASKVVPNVVGKTDADANTAITSVNLKVGTVTTAYSNTVDANKVISQSPAAGKAVAIGSAVDYVKSLGKPTVPDIVGKMAADANTAITSVNLKVGTVTTAYDTNAAGNVISQSPVKNTVVLIGSAVNYVKSLGSKPLVPDIVGEPAADANTDIVNANLKVGTVTAAYDSNAAGTVISQSPVKNTVVLIGSAVNYVKSLGPKQTVPKVVGMTESNANTAIVNANLVVGTVTTAHSNTVVAHMVISQSPAVGTKVAIGSAVSYVTSLGK